VLNFNESWVEFDLNPIVIFNKDSKILTLNQEATFLLATVDKNELFSLALSHAPSSFGFETKYITISLGRFNFFALSVGYITEENIGIKLYKVFEYKKQTLIQNKNSELINIYTLIDLAISTNSIDTNTKIHIKNFDPTLPETRLYVLKFVNLLDMIYKSSTQAKHITSTLKLITGEYIVIENKKYPAIKLDIKVDSNLANIDNNLLQKLADENSILCEVHQNSISITFPLITK